MGAGGLAMLVYALSAAVTLGSVGGGVLMFTHRLARREGFVARVAALAGLVAVGALTGSAAAPALGEVVGTSYALQLALFSGMLALLVGAVTWLYETTAWTALFCCTAGYAMQNFASGLTELCWALAGVPETADASLGAHLTRFGINVTCILAVYVPFYLGFVRKISREALERIDNPALLAVMAAVMLGVIGFDLLIKCMGDFGLLTIWFMAPLRLFHGLMCVCRSSGRRRRASTRSESASMSSAEPTSRPSTSNAMTSSIKLEHSQAAGRAQTSARWRTSRMRWTSMTRPSTQATRLWTRSLPRSV